MSSESEPFAHARLENISVETFKSIFTKQELASRVARKLLDETKLKIYSPSIFTVEFATNLWRFFLLC